MTIKQDCRADVGISTLILFIAIIIMATLVVVPLVDTIGRFTEKAVQTGRETRGHITTGITVISVSGQTTDNSTTDHGITNLSILIEPITGSGIIDLDTMIILVCAEGRPSVILKYSGTSNSYEDGFFNVSRWIRLIKGNESDRMNDPYIGYGDLVEISTNTTVYASDFGPNTEVNIVIMLETGINTRIEFRTPLVYPVPDEYVELY